MGFRAAFYVPNRTRFGFAATAGRIDFTCRSLAAIASYRLILNYRGFAAVMGGASERYLPRSALFAREI